MPERLTPPDAKRDALGKIKDLQMLLRDYFDDSKERVHPLVSEYAKKLMAILEAIGNAINSGMVTPSDSFQERIWQMQEKFFEEADNYKDYQQEQIEKRHT